MQMIFFQIENDMSDIVNSWGDELLPKSINPQSTSCRLPGCQSCFGVYWIFLIIILMIFLHWVLLLASFGKNYKSGDILNRKIISIGNVELSGWNLSHFVLFFILGFIFPNCLMILVMAGLLWELVEYTTGYIIKTYLNKKDEKVNDPKIAYSDQYLTWSYLDPFMDIAGLLLGAGLRILISKT